MQNFGRGMWRRVGDFERLHQPVLLQQSRIEHNVVALEQWKQFVQYQNMLKKQQQIQAQLPSVQQQQQDINNKDNKLEYTDPSKNVFVTNILDVEQNIAGIQQSNANELLNIQRMNKRNKRREIDRREIEIERREREIERREREIERREIEREKYTENEEI